MNPSYDNSFGSFASGGGASSSVVPPRNGEIVLSSNSKPKKKKFWVVILVLFVIAALVLAIVFSINSVTGDKKQEQNYSKEELYSSLWDFYYEHYQDLASQYNMFIGYEPKLEISKYSIIFPISGSSIDKLLEELKDTVSAYDVLPDSNTEDYKTIKSDIGENLLNIKKNLGVVNEFYEAFIGPFLETNFPKVCRETDDIKALMEGNNLETAEKYYQIYCELIAFTRTSDDFSVFQQENEDEINAAANSLSGLLVDVKPLEEDIEGLIEELLE